MSYMNEEYKPHFGTNRANMFRDDASWGGENRDVRRGGGSRDDMTWGSGNRDVNRGSGFRDDMTWGSGNRDLNKGNEDMIWGNGNRDVNRGSGNKDDMWGSGNRDVNRGSGNKDDMIWGSGNSDVNQGSGNKDDMAWGGRNRDDLSRGGINRGNMNRDMSRGSTNRGNVNREMSRGGINRGNVNRDMSRGGINRGNMKRDDVSRSYMSRDNVKKDDMTWSRVSRDDVNDEDMDMDIDDGSDGTNNEPSWGMDRDVSREGINKNDQRQGNMNRDDMTWGNMKRGGQIQGNMNRGGQIQGNMNRGGQIQGNMNRGGQIQGNMNRGGLSQGDFNQGDANQQDLNQGDKNQVDMDLDDQNQSDSTQANTADVTSSDLQKDNTISEKPEDDKKKLYCEICRLTCLSAMSYQSHIRGSKHLKQARTSRYSSFSGMYKAKKLNKCGQTLKDYMDEPVREPLIGLEHVLEYRLPGRFDPNYSCDLCEFKTELAPMIEHLNGFKHRRAYISKEFPFLLKAPPGQKEDKVQFLRRMAADIERDEGLKMYRIDLVSKKKKIKSLLEIKPDEITVKKSRWDTLVPNNETLKTKALRSVEAFEIDSDAEALLVMTITQDLTSNLKTYCLKIKEEADHAEKVARAKSVAEALSNPNAAQQTPLQTSIADQYPTVIGKWKLVPMPQSKAAQYAAGGPNWNQESMHNPLPPKAQYGAGMDDWSHDPMMQVRQVLKAENNSGLRPFAPNEPRGPGGFPSGNRGFGNEYSRFDSGPSSMAGGPSQFFTQSNNLQRSNPSAPSLSRMLDVPMGANATGGFMGGIKDQGTRFQSAGTPANFSTGPKMLPMNRDIQGRMGNFGHTQLLPPNAHLNADRLPIGPSAAMEFPRAFPQEKTEKKASPLTAEILNKIRGKDVKSASVILTSLAATNQALQKVNIANLLNLLVQTGTIK